MNSYHAYGALWRLQERFEPEVCIQREDLRWTGAFRATWPFDDRAEPASGIALLHVGGHFEGQSVLYDAPRRTLFAGDALKFHFEGGQGRLTGISCHKAFNNRIPLSHAEIRKYREVLAPLDFDQVFTTFEHAPAGRDDALRLFDAQLAGRPFFGPLPLER